MNLLSLLGDKHRISLIKSLVFVVLSATLHHLPAYAAPPVAATDQKIQWGDFSNEQFTKAASQKKLLLLDLEAVWCHWCHVMEKETYSKKEVIQEIQNHYIAMKVDQDSRPDLSVRFGEFGWPATIIFTPDGTVVRALTGYQEADLFLIALKEAFQNPTPKTSQGAVEVDIPKEAALSSAYREALLQKHARSLDREKGGLRTTHRFLDADTLEYALIKASHSSEEDAHFAKLTLSANMKLLDPAWGGIYQYSTHSDWDHPHFEKIMPTQADNIRIYSLAYALWGEEAHWKTATAIYLYLKKFMTSPEGAFYTSQDADLKKGEHSEDYFSLNDADRRAKGIPAIDTSRYSRENGLAISALCTLYAATGNQSIYDDAEKAARWILANRRKEGGTFSHGEKDTGGPFLADNVAMADALLSLYASSGKRNWLTEAQTTGDAIAKIFGDYSGDSLQPGFFTDRHDDSGPLKPLKTIAENVRLARYFNLLSFYTGDSRYRDYANAAMRYIATPAHGTENINDTAILVADLENSSEPLHITIVGQKDDQLAHQLFMAGLRYFSTYKRIEWWDKREGAMPNPDVEYPQMQKSAAFICTNKRCSLPIFKPEGIADTIKLFHKDIR